MPIDFSCTGCAKLLRVSDESAGKDARCPDCGAINRVPTAGAAPFTRASTPVPTPGLFSEQGPPASSNPFGAGPVNPYAAPQASSYAPDAASLPIQPTVVSVEPIMNYAWQLWQQHLGLLIGVYLPEVVGNAVLDAQFGPPGGAAITPQEFISIGTDYVVNQFNLKTDKGKGT